MLNFYLQATQNLLQNPKAPGSLYPIEDLTTYINTARRQIAGSDQIIRVLADLPTISGQNLYPANSIILPAGQGIGKVLNVRMITQAIPGQGTILVDNEPWEWFNQYRIAIPEAAAGPPTIWAQYAQGNFLTLFFYPTPSTPGALKLDTVCYPIDLVDDTTPDAIPQQWTDAVPFFAAFYALLSAQTSARQAEAEKMYNLYETFADRARRASTSDVLPFHFEKTSPRNPPMPGGISAPQPPSGGGGQ
jgi:hypothetical protein